MGIPLPKKKILRLYLFVKTTNSSPVPGTEHEPAIVVHRLAVDPALARKGNRDGFDGAGRSIRQRTWHSALCASMQVPPELGVLGWLFDRDGRKPANLPVDFGYPQLSKGDILPEKPPRPG
jgi:hypothetical protein